MHTAFHNPKMIALIAVVAMLGIAGSVRAQSPDPLATGIGALTDCDFAHAIEIFSTAIDTLPPDDNQLPRAHVFRGIAHEWRGDLNLAVADHSRALNLDPNHYEALEHRLSVYDKLGERELADADLEAHGRLALAQFHELDRRRVVLERGGEPPVVLHFLGERSEGFRGRLTHC